MNSCFTTKHVILMRDTALPTVDGDVTILATQLMEKEYQQNGSVSVDLTPYHIRLWWEITYTLWSGDFLSVTFFDLSHLTEFEQVIRQWMYEQYLPYVDAVGVLDRAKRLVSQPA